MKNHPDDRRDNVEKIQNNIDNTLQNMEAAREMIDRTDNDKTKKDLKEKNKRRGEALESMRAEIQDEATDRKSCK
ncbi:MAG: small acid-soluble spore protein Tlp [Syntrophomonadaceae bacterium]|nr:small acid-soluble spore protein Tlp [Syntrophomonadaceae bacterium]